MRQSLKIQQKDLIQEVESLPWPELLQLLEEEKNEEVRKSIVWARCATDLALFAEIYFPHYCTSDFNGFHLDYFSSVRFGERAVRRIRGAPRGAAKSTLATLIKPIHDVCYGLENFIVIISNTSPLSERKLKDIRDEIISNDLLRQDYGLRFTTKRPAETQFIVRSNESSWALFMAFGKGAQIRGVRYRQHRPSKIIIDDAEHSDEVHNEAIRQKDAAWFLEDVTKCGNKNTNIEVVGTILHRESLLKRLLDNPAYDGRIHKAVISWSEREDLWEKWRDIYTNLDNRQRLEDAEAFYKQNESEMLRGVEVLWPSNEPYLLLMKEMIEIGRPAFYKEKQNEPLGAEDKVFQRIHKYEEVNDGFRMLESGVVIPWSQLRFNGAAVIDPATGKTKPKKGRPGDFTCLLVGYADPQGRVFVHFDETKRQPPTQYIESIFDLHQKFSYNRMGVETNLYRELLLPNIIAERKRRNEERAKKGQEPLRLQFYEIEQTENKHERIFRIEPKVSHGWLVFNRSLSAEFYRQLEDFPHAEHDDCPDALEMLWNAYHNRYRAGGVAKAAMG